MRQIGNKVSYVKNPLAKNSFYCLGLGIVSLLLGALSMYFSVRNAGQGGTEYRSLWVFKHGSSHYGGSGTASFPFTEDDCNYIFSQDRDGFRGNHPSYMGHHYIYRYIQIK